MSKTPVIGIDLGNTYSCVAVFRRGNVEVLSNEHGQRTTPCYVAFNEKERLIGQAAKDQAGANPENTAFGVKRLIGRNFKDVCDQEDISHWPFKVINDQGKPSVQLTVAGEPRHFTPEQLSSMVLEKMRDIAKNFLGVEEEIMKAVITVPAYFNNSQRQATKDAGKIANLDVIRVINEPTAAGIAYGFNNDFSKPKNVLIFDLGGGTFDVSILKIHDGLYQVLATAGDTHLGGEDFDSNVVTYCVSDIDKRLKKQLNNKALYRLRVACERAKRNLSENNSTTITVDSLVDNIDYSLNLRRVKFEELNKELFEKLEDQINKALEDADLTPIDIDSIVLVGGSSRISKVQTMIKEKFNNKEINKNIHPDEAVAYGAAIMGAYLINDDNEKLKNFKLRDVTPLSLGMEIYGGEMSVLINRNVEVPTEATTYLTTNQTGQRAVSIVVYEGERKLVKDNNKLGQFTIQGIAKAPRGAPKIEIKFEVDKDGILMVSARDTGNKLSKKYSIKCDNGRLSEPAIRQMIQDAKHFEEDDRKERERVRAKLKLEDFCLRTNSIVAGAKAKMSPMVSEQILKQCQEMLDWLYDHENEDTDAYVTRFKDLAQKCDTFT